MAELKRMGDISPAQFWAVLKHDRVGMGMIRASEGSAMRLLGEHLDWCKRAGLPDDGFRVAKIQIIEVVDGTVAHGVTNG